MLKISPTAGHSVMFPINIYSDPWYFSILQNLASPEKRWEIIWSSVVVRGGSFTKKSLHFSVTFEELFYKVKISTLVAFYFFPSQHFKNSIPLFSLAWFLRKSWIYLFFPSGFFQGFFF